MIEFVQQNDYHKQLGFVRIRNESNARIETSIKRKRDIKRSKTRAMKQRSRIGRRDEKKKQKQKKKIGRNDSSVIIYGI